MDQTSKVRFVAQAVRNLMTLGQIVRQTREMIDVFTDREYGPGKTNEITEQDLGLSIPAAGIDLRGMTVAQWLEIAGTMADFVAWADGSPQTPKNKEAVINKYREDL